MGTAEGRAADRPTRIRNQYGNFAQIPEILVKDSKVSDRALRVYALLWTYTIQKRRTAWPSRKEMAETLDVSVSTIDRAIRELETRGAIAVESDFKGVRQTTNIYTILVLHNDPKSIHRGRKFAAPQLSTGAANLNTPGAANLNTQEEEQQEEEIYSPVPEVTSDPGTNNNRTGQHHPAATPKTVSATHGQPLQPADVFTSCGHWLPTTFDDHALETLAAEILARAASRVLDPTAYVIKTIRGWHRHNLTGADLADVGEWAMRVDEIAREREFAKITADIGGGF